jgi:hypothetical protein
MDIYYKKIKMFMKLKGDEIKKLTKQDFYCSDNAILSIDDSEYTYNKLKNNIFVHNAHSLGQGVCPFCIGCICLSCGWAKENGNCLKDIDSLYQTIHDFKISSDLTNKFYRSIIEKIEKKYKSNTNETWR